MAPFRSPPVVHGTSIRSEWPTFIKQRSRICLRYRKQFGNRVYQSDPCGRLRVAGETPERSGRPTEGSESSLFPTGICKRVRSMLNINTAKLLYNSLVLPHFDYFNSIVNNSHTKLRIYFRNSKIEVLEL